MEFFCRNAFDLLGSGFGELTSSATEKSQEVSSKVVLDGLFFASRW
jgi:hypothetical protein